MTFKLSVLDQSFTRSPEQAPQAFQETIEMAKLAETLGYQRFWVSEHHGFATLAGSVPEVLLAALGAATNTIRLGSGGIMLPHYSAYKVAESFSVLANLYPGRIERFPKLVEELTAFLRDDLSSPVVSPKPPKDLPIWMLGSSADSAELAAQKGLPYNLGLFINPEADKRLIRLYKQYFQTNGDTNKPHGMITMSVFCADSEQHAKAQQLAFDVNFYRYITGQRDAASGGGLLTPEQAQSFAMTPQLQAFIDSRSKNRAVGSPDQVRQKVTAIARDYGADEVMVVTNMFHFEDRKRSFELLMQAFSSVETSA
jgi:alkanesulfonate monooxygenase SsuD/methylene tetrahydromethanopterin reductase-like flavin-dependent oxidoreductase (luciferase family)